MCHICGYDPGRRFHYGFRPRARINTSKVMLHFTSTWTSRKWDCRHERARNLIYRSIIRSKKIRDPFDHKLYERRNYLLQFHKFLKRKFDFGNRRDHLEPCRHVVYWDKRVLYIQWRIFNLPSILTLNFVGYLTSFFCRYIHMYFITLIVYYFTIFFNILIYTIECT